MSARFPRGALRAFHTRHADPAPAEPTAPLERALWALLALASAAIVAVVLRGDARWVDPLVSEEGPLEAVAALAWLLLAPLVLWRGGRSGPAVALALVCAVFGARELDLHKIVAGTSFLKTNFYRGDAVGVPDKLIGGALALAVLAIVAYGLVVNARAFLRRRAWRSSWGRIVVLAVALLVLSKLLDRTPAILKDEWHAPLGWTASHLVTVHEEWLEAFVPIALAAAALGYRRRETPARRA